MSCWRLYSLLLLLFRKEAVKKIVYIIFFLWSRFIIAQLGFDITKKKILNLPIQSVHLFLTAWQVPHYNKLSNHFGDTDFQRCH